MVQVKYLPFRMTNLLFIPLQYVKTEHNPMHKNDCYIMTSRTYCKAELLPYCFLIPEPHVSIISPSFPSLPLHLPHTFLLLLSPTLP